MIRTLRKLVFLVLFIVLATATYFTLASRDELERYLKMRQM